MGPQLELSRLDHEHLYWLPEIGSRARRSQELGMETIVSTAPGLGLSLFIVIVGAAAGTMEPGSTVPNEKDEDGDQGDDKDEGDDGDGAHEDEQLSNLIV